MSVAVNGLTNRVIGDSYDLNGNLTATAGGATYTWDAANRLTQFQSAQVTESYAYDPQNRRVWRRDGAGNEFVALYGIDGQLANESGLGNHPPGGVCYWGSGLGNVRLGTQLLWKSTGVEVSDRLGSTAGVGSGFYPYGEAKAGTPASARYATYGRDTTGLHCALNRHYDPRQGRFLSPDPYEASAGAADPQSWNRYAYVQNDPVNRADPTGLLFCSAEFSHCQGLGASPFIDTGGSLGGGWNWGASIGGIFSISIWAFPWPTPVPSPSPGDDWESEEEPQRASFLQIVDLCFEPNGGKGTTIGYTLAVKYRVLDQNTNPIYGNAALNAAGAAVSEEVTTTSGPQIVGGGVWCPAGGRCSTPGSMDPSGHFWDILAGDPKGQISTADQTFLIGGRAVPVLGFTGSPSVLKNSYSTRLVTVHGRTAKRRCDNDGDPI
jgi:RHS repeat-associated protein